MRYRIEKDSLGEKVIPLEAYYGIKSLRSKDAYQITKHGQCRQNIKAFAQIKKIFAKTNFEFGFLEKEKADAIMLSADELLNGRLHGQFITDQIQDGYGYGMNDNASEVIANRANEMLGGEKGRYEHVTLEDVNLNQEIEEVVVLSGKITTVRLVKKLIVEGKKLVNAIEDAVDENKEANSNTLLSLNSISNILERDIKRLDKTLGSLLEINLGINVNSDVKEEYAKKLLKNLNQSGSEKYAYPDNDYDSRHSLDSFMYASTILKNLITNFSKSMNDLKHLVIEKKVSFAQLQEVEYDEENTLIFDMVKQISFYIMGNDLTISRSVEEGELGNNLFKPMIYACINESANLVRRTLRTIREKVIETIVIK